MDDWLVGGVACMLGLAGIAAAITSADWPLRWSIARGLQQVGGRLGMRLGYFLGGVALITLGVSIACKVHRNCDFPAFNAVPQTNKTTDE